VRVRLGQVRAVLVQRWNATSCCRDHLTHTYAATPASQRCPDARD
jgi:hypothetical protein